MPYPPSCPISFGLSDFNRKLGRLTKDFLTKPDAEPEDGFPSDLGVLIPDKSPHNSSGVFWLALGKGVSTIDPNLSKMGVSTGQQKKTFAIEGQSSLFS
ncbi:MAG: hypothetical protein NT142_05550 [Planctomycetota bacterium]|nr:hypothetical protein [Planctomycetota bacterium]